MDARASLACVADGQLSARCILLAAVTGLGVETYGQALVSVFMFQQLTLMMMVPPLLVLGSPGTLLLRATPHHGAGRVVLKTAHGALRNPAAKWVLSPWATVPLYLFAFYGIYLAGAADVILTAPGGHVALEVGFLLAGMLFTIPSCPPILCRSGWVMVRVHWTCLLKPRCTRSSGCSS